MSVDRASALNLVMLGPPGAGKGTQAERFAQKHRVPKISTGDILREAVTSDGELGRAAKQVMDAGRLIGDDIMIGIVTERLAREDAKAGFVLDGFPRTVRQAEALDGMLGVQPLVVVDIVVPEETLLRRLASRRMCGACGHSALPEEKGCPKCGGELVVRIDDSAGIVSERLRIYMEQTAPIVQFYRGRRGFQAIDGTTSPEDVQKAICDAVTAIAGGVA
ncbi:MAG: adenylate kinase [Acidobacteriota bacterium]|nr:adenylate kinase [Acidobacteriota bacterium]